MTTVVTGVINSGTDTTTQVRCIEDLIHNVSPDAVPLTKLIGDNSIKNPAVFSTTYEWLEDELDPLTSSCGTVATTNEATLTLITSADSLFFRVGHVIKVDDELMWVSASNYAGTLSVTRGWGDTSGAAHSTGAVINIVGIAMIEGANAVTGHRVDVSTGYNYTQIFQETCEVTGTQEVMKQYGIKNEMTYQIAKKYKSLALLRERGLLQGYRSARSGVSTAGTFGGIPQYVSNNVTAMSSAAITEKALVDVMQNCYDDVGQEYMPNLIVCNGWIHRKISEFYRANTRMDRAERTGGVWVNRIDTQFGQLDVMLNKNCPSDDVWLLNTKLISMGPLNGRAFFEKDLAIDGDTTKKEIIGEYTVKFPTGQACGGLTGCSTTT